MIDQKVMYDRMRRQLQGMIEGCDRPLSVLSNCAAILWNNLDQINWAGFYLLSGEELLLGPFQGKVACMRIELGKGVCGTAAMSREIQLVPDVHQFPGHIACDSASNSEIVLPLLRNGILYGVMDIDSPILNRFDQRDAEGLTSLCDLMMSALKWENGLL